MTTPLPASTSQRARCDALRRNFHLCRPDSKDSSEAVLCIDALEMLPPEDWPLVLANLRRAVKPGGLLHLTVELIEATEQIEQRAKSQPELKPLIDFLNDSTPRRERVGIVR